MWLLVGILAGGVAVSAVIAFVGSLVLQGSVKLVTKRELDTDRVYTTAFYSALAMFALTFALGIAFMHPLAAEAEQSFSRAKALDPYGWERDPKATGIEAVLGWGATSPVHIQVQGLAALLSIAAWIAILRVRHRVELLQGVLVVLMSQVIWAAIIAAAWGVWLGFAALYHAVEG